MARVHRIECVKCDIEMQYTILPSYEYLEGLPLAQVPAYTCPRCHQIFFTEQHANAMHKRTAQIMQQRFAFERRVTISGKSLAITIPQELAVHIGIKQGSKVRLRPVEQHGFMVMAEGSLRRKSPQGNL